MSDADIHISSATLECTVGHYIKSHEVPIDQQLDSIKNAIELLIEFSKENDKSHQQKHYTNALLERLPQPRILDTLRDSSMFETPVLNQIDPNIISRSQEPIEILYDSFDLSECKNPLATSYRRATKHLLAGPRVFNPSDHAISTPDFAIRFEANSPVLAWASYQRLFGVGTVKTVMVDELGDTLSQVEANARFKQCIAMAVMHLATAWRMSGAWLGIAVCGPRFSRIIMLDAATFAIEIVPHQASSTPAEVPFDAFLRTHAFSSLAHNLINNGKPSRGKLWEIDKDSYEFFSYFFDTSSYMIRRSTVLNALRPSEHVRTREELFGDIIPSLLDNSVRSGPLKRPRTSTVAAQAMRKKSRVRLCLWDKDDDPFKRQSIRNAVNSSEQSSEDDDYEDGSSSGDVEEANDEMEKHHQRQQFVDIRTWRNMVRACWDDTTRAETDLMENEACRDVWTGFPEYCHGRDPFDIIKDLKGTVIPVDADTFEMLQKRRSEEAGLIEVTS